MATTYDWTEDTIDSRDIISRHEELEDLKSDLESAIDEAEEELQDNLNASPDELNDYKSNLFEAQDDLKNFEFEDELQLLKYVISEGEGSPDWQYGEGLIKESHFTDYIQELINDCYEMPKEFESGKWPWNNMTMDWEAAADEAKADYFEIEIGDNTYYIRA